MLILVIPSQFASVGDGDADLLLIDRDGSSLLVENVGSPSRPKFEVADKSENPLFMEFPVYGMPTLFDVDGDGDSDILFRTDASTGALAYYENGYCLMTGAEDPCLAVRRCYRTDHRRSHLGGLVRIDAAATTRIVRGNQPLTISWTGSR